MPPTINMNTTELLLASLGGIAVLYLASKALSKKPSHPLPPGLKTLPILGNFTDLPEREGWLIPSVYRDLSRKLGSDVLHFDLLGASIIVVNTEKAATELFEKRASIYSGRPELNALRKLLAVNWLAVLMPYGQEWRDIRKAYRDHFGLAEYHGVETKAAHTLLRSLVANSTDYMEHFKTMTGSTAVAIAYGIEAQPNDSYIKAAQNVLLATVYGTSTFALAFDAIPSLLKAPSWFLGGQYKKDAKPKAREVTEALEAPFRAVKTAIKNGTAKPSVASNMLQSVAEGKYPNDVLAKQVPANVVFSGANFPVSAMGSFITAMAKYPDVQRKAQAEIDAVVGAGRLPEFSDEPSMPYVTALVKEVLRWRPIAPLAIPHAALDDDVYEGYYIPKGSIVLGNSWAILHDEKTFPDPDTLLPERWLNKKEFPDVAFGFGRRLCPGRFFVRDVLWITFASILATCDVTKAVDAQGNVLEPKEEYTPTILTFPVPVECQIKPRSEAARKLIQATASDGPLTA